MRPKNIEKEDAIRKKALEIIEREGLENLSMQKLAAAANISPRTIYIKYADKEDFLVKLFIDEVLAGYEKAVLQGFTAIMAFEEGIKKLWLNSFSFLTANKPAFALMQYGKTSPLLNKAYTERNIEEGQFFAPIHAFLTMHTKAGIVKKLPLQVQRALLFAPLFELVKEYFDYTDRPVQIITDDVIAASCDAVIQGMLAPAKNANTKK